LVVHQHNVGVAVQAGQVAVQVAVQVVVVLLIMLLVLEVLE
jgi:hypothetical protein